MTVALVTSAVLAGPFATTGRAAPPRCSIAGRITPHPAPDPPPAPDAPIPLWYSIDVPDFPSGPQVIGDYAVDPLAADNLYVSNGEVVMRSTDAGCHWSVSYSLPTSGAGATIGNARIVEIEVGAPGIIFLPIQQLQPTPKPHIVVSTDAGASWSDASGTPLNSLVGVIEDLDASHGNRLSAAILVDVQHAEPGSLSIDSGQVLLVTDTQGQVWEPRAFRAGDTTIGNPVVPVTVPGPDDEFESIAMNPLRPNEIWLHGENGVALYNGSPQLVDINLGPIGLLDISLDGQGILAFPRARPVAYQSVDGGGTFGEFRLGFTADSVDISIGVPTVAAVGGLGRVYYLVQFPGQDDANILDVSPPDGRAVSDVQVAVPDAAALPAIYGRTAETLEVTYEPEGVEVDVDVVSAVAPASNVSSVNTLQPDGTVVTLRRGASRTLPYGLELPAANTPLDVYFMIDISGSMQTAINGIRGAMHEIVSRLTELQIDVRFGVGAFRAYNDPPAYDRVRDIGPSGPALAAALNSLRAGGGGLETQMAALLQSVTGDGDSVIPSGLDMHFREGSLRVAIEVTDEPISQGGQHPSYLEVIDALVAHDVKQVGIAVQDAPLLGDHDYENPGPPADILQEVASGSAATAPPTGVDCDGDGDLEIQPGGPVVCMVAPSDTGDAALMADAIVNMLQALEDIQDLDVSVSHAADPAADVRVLESIVPEVLPRVDLKEPSAHAFEVSVRCPYVPQRTLFPLRVAVARRGGVLADASLTVICKGPPPGEEPVRVLAPFVPAAIVPPPPPRPPDPVPEPNPNPNPNPQQNPQTQAGFAAQEQQQPQVALAAQTGPEPVVEEALTDEYMMSSHDEQSRIPPVGFIFAAGGITSIYAYAMATRLRSRTAHARNRRRKEGGTR
ncbi:MAG: VWA domain-containing protein [Actinomycetota bacterium]|nr:VWA domain-containing protein [Actinomycetota bacterium]